MTTLVNALEADGAVRQDQRYLVAGGIDIGIR